MSDATSSPDAAPRWQPLSAIDRRVAGVLIEKAKTTPDVYPMSLNGIVTACNQKSNRHPAMQLEADGVEQSLERLREAGAVGLIQGVGRVQKYRHYLYEWLGVDKVELAVMAELLLRGAQTEGELRGRAARMEPIADLTALRPVLASLQAKGLVISLTPEGRGHVVSHALYMPREMENLKAQHAALASAALASDREPSETESVGSASRTAPAAAAGSSAAVEELRAQVAQLRADVDELANVLDQTNEELRRLRQELGA